MSNLVILNSEYTEWLSDNKWVTLSPNTLKKMIRTLISTNKITTEHSKKQPTAIHYSRINYDTVNDWNELCVDIKGKKHQICIASSVMQVDWHNGIRFITLIVKRQTGYPFYDGYISKWEQIARVSMRWDIEQKG